MNIEAKAHVLIEALPWIRQFSGKTIVIKFGGNAMVSEELKAAFAQDVAFLHHVGIRPVIVHGGGPQINEMLDKLGIQSTFAGGYRITSEDAMDVVRMVLTGKVQRELVSLINKDAPYAVGLSGEDAGLFTATKRHVFVDGKETDLGQVGDIATVDPSAVLDLLDAGRIPVVSTVASEAGGDGVLNVNADAAAAALAVALDAVKLVMLTDVAGVYRNWPDTSSLISQMSVTELEELLPSLESGMVPKMTGALDAVKAGVAAAHIIDGRMPHSMLLEVFTPDGVGTLVTKDDHEL